MEKGKKKKESPFCLFYEDDKAALLNYYNSVSKWCTWDMGFFSSDENFVFHLNVIFFSFLCFEHLMHFSIKAIIE